MMLSMGSKTVCCAHTTLSCVFEVTCESSGCVIFVLCVCVCVCCVSSRFTRSLDSTQTQTYNFWLRAHFVLSRFDGTSFIRVRVRLLLIQAASQTDILLPSRSRSLPPTSTPTTRRRGPCTGSSRRPSRATPRHST